MKRILFLMLTASFAASPASFAAASDADIEQMRTQLAAMSQRLEELAAENAKLKRAQDQATIEIADVRTSVAEVRMAEIPAASGGWSDRIKLKGDVRFRHERVDEDGEEDRARGRFRARIGMTADIQENLKFALQLASGGDNPVSTNQTIDGGFSTKDIGIDLAYLDWKIRDGVNFYAGKMKNPMFKAGGVPLVWDGDLNLEGAAVKYSAGNLFGTVGGYSVEERSSSDDSLLFTAQGGFNFPLGDTISLTAGAGYFGYSDTVGNEPFYDGRAKGNSVDANGDYINEYKNFEVFAQLDTELAGMPLKVYGHWTQNDEVSTEDTAYAFGAKLGSAKKDGQWEFGWTYQDIEADSVIATFNDSDFGGGGTDSDGHLIKSKYAVNDSFFLGGTLMINDVDRIQGIEHDYNRLQLDVEFKFK